MDLNFDTIYTKPSAILKKEVIDLKNVSFFDPWAIGIICLTFIEEKEDTKKKLILPDNLDTKQYLKRMHLDKFIQGLPCSSSFLGQFEEMGPIEHENLNVQEILHCNFRDDFNARLESRMRRMFKNFGMNDNDEQSATTLVGELGNNVFDHNEGLWPSDVRGAIIVAQNYPMIKKIEVTIADPGIGFFGSLSGVSENPPLTDIEAIKMGLRGITGRVGERRGNGLKLVQEWTISKLDGLLRIHSGSGLVVVDKNGQKEFSVNKISGTLAGFVVSYK